ncbi:hypothetical protein [Sanyastnella coralliicola]|uniref:hypothetical protein n=1 Tax=Sanyastnella coralliicola TaxID=3069118 RepID=UPI0027B9B457|nr:hypothetical protein [Longitalea sp. SCSIO 12813]
METGLQHMHSALRWVILVLLVLSIVRAYAASSSGKPFASIKKLAMFTMIGLHIQLLIGLALYFLKGWAGQWGTEGMMSNTLLRFFTMEHLLLMILAIAVATMGYSGAKRKTDDKKANKRVFVFYLIALILILAGIPWPFRSGFEAYGWF